MIDIPTRIQAIIQYSIPQNIVRTIGRHTSPRSYGVYELPPTAKDTRRYRFGNHPIRQEELIREFGNCKLAYLFPERHYAKTLADILNE